MAVTATLAAAVMSTGAAQAKAPEGRTSTLCRSYQHMVVQRGSSHYVVRNDNFGHTPECLTNRNGSPNFAVASSRAHAKGGPEPVAFPNIFAGCSWGVCSPHTRLPLRISKIKSLLTTWHTKMPSKGSWGAGYDIWFDRKRVTSGQSGGAELMIWLNSRGFGVSSWPVVTVDHQKWHLEHWVTEGHGKKWNYIQFRRVHATKKVTNLNVRAFIAAAERKGLIRNSWWLTSVEAGFEIWRGGVGLSTKSFAVRVRT
jgi:Glycosyl hydrolase family 12